MYHFCRRWFCNCSNPINDNRNSKYGRKIMALSAVVTLPTSSLPVGAPEIQALVTVSNSGPSEVFITNAIPSLFSTSEPEPRSSFKQNLGNVYLPPSSPASPSTTLPLTFSVVFNSGSGLGTLSVGCRIYGSDGSITEATPATITIVGNNQNA